MYKSLNISERLLGLSEKVELDLKDDFAQIDKTAEYNQLKVLKAFKDHRVSDTHFIGTTGYGYSDKGRDTLDKIFAQVFGAQDALVRHNFISGTHALTVALFGILRPGDTLLSVTGKPYDTLEEVIGIREGAYGSLKDFGINYRQVDLIHGKAIDFDAINSAIDKSVKVIYIQRSRGYMQRATLVNDDIKEIVGFVKGIDPELVVMVDNCYGEFVERHEPCNVGADLIVGSLIKNPGGGMADTGGYIAGNTQLVEKCANRLTSPGIGKEAGASLNQNKNMYKGLFFAPHVTGEALKTAVFAGALFEAMGFEVSPKAYEKRGDIIEVITFNNPETLIAFCKGIQSGAPVDSFVTPEPWEMPGYDSQVIMAAGAFTQGASIELSADAPLIEPYCAFLQGSLTYHSGKAGVLLAAQELICKKLINL